MKKAVEIKNLNFKYDNYEVFKNFSLAIEDGKITTIIGNNGCGKTTLVKLILGFLKSENIIVKGLNLDKDNIKSIRRKIGVLFENPDNTFVAETVIDDIVFSLENLNYSKKEMDKKIEAITEYLKIGKLLDKNPYYLSGGEKQLVALAGILIAEPEIIILDEALTMIDGEDKKAIYDILKSINVDKKVTIINITNDMEDILYSDNLVLLKSGELILNDKLEDAIYNEKAFTTCDLELPFMVDLSKKLGYYELLDRIILDEEEMVDELWK